MNTNLLILLATAPTASLWHNLRQRFGYPAYSALRQVQAAYDVHYNRIPF